MDAAKAMLRGQAAIKDGAAVIGDKPLADHVTEWAGTDQGKHFITAPANSGGGGQGGAVVVARPTAIWAAPVTSVWRP